MLVSHRKKFIFIKVPKTAGTSIEVYFQPYCVPENTRQFSVDQDSVVSEAGIVGCRGREAEGRKWWNHMPARLIKKELGASLWDQYFKFCVIRNPFERLVSAFHFQEKTRLNSPRQDQIWRGGLSVGKPSAKCHPGPWMREAAVDRFRAWVKSSAMRGGGDMYRIDGKIEVDYFIRFEELESGLRHVCNVLGIPFKIEDLPKLKTGYRPAEAKAETYFDRKTVELVKKRFEFEMNLFGYKAPLI